MLYPNPFRSAEGKAAFLAAYDAAMKTWPTPYDELEIPSRFGTTHVVVCGPTDAPPLVLLHGYMATLTMWAPNVGDFSRDFRVYAIDIMGQPSKSIPSTPIRTAEEYNEWLATTIDALRLHSVCLAGVSYGGWLALNQAIAHPEHVAKLVLLSAGGLLPLSTQFITRGLLMGAVTTRFTVNWTMRWMGLSDRPGPADARPLLELMYQGLKHFRIPKETRAVKLPIASDAQLERLPMPVLLLMGEREVLCDPSATVARARRLIPNAECDLISGCSHDMSFTKREIVDQRVLQFLRRTDRGPTAERDPEVRHMIGV